MGSRKLLDCTLRDGGYVNDWEFGHANIVEIFERLVSSHVDYIEVGFLDERRSFDINRTIMPDTEAVNKIFSGLNKGNSVILGMIDFGTCGIEHIQPAEKCFLDGIRVIFKEHLMYPALEFCRQLKELGYKVFAQMVSVTTYTDEKLKEYAALVNSVKPYATSMVDTYGLMDETVLHHIFSVLDAELDSDIKLGFHAHNNFQLAFSNSRNFLNFDTDRDLITDGTLYAMGKSAGNAAIELLMMEMNRKRGTCYDLPQVMEAIDNVILNIYRKQYWGYNLKFYISALIQCHPNYVSYLMDKRTLSVKQILEILGTLKGKKKLLYDATYAEEIYLHYQDMKCDDESVIQTLQKQFCGRTVLAVGPGKTIKRESRKIRNFIEQNNPLIISVNYLPASVSADYVFLTNAKRYNQLINELNRSLLKEVQTIATSNVTKIAGQFHYVLNYESLIDRDTEIIDNSLIMLLKCLIRCGVNQIALAGFDGYSRRSDNYFDTSREYSFVKEKADYLNSYVMDFIRQHKNELTVSFVTRSHYEDKGEHR